MGVEEGSFKVPDAWGNLAQLALEVHVELVDLGEGEPVHLHLALRRLHDLAPKAKVSDIPRGTVTVTVRGVDRGAAGGLLVVTGEGVGPLRWVSRGGVAPLATTRHS